VNSYDESSLRGRLVALDACIDELLHDHHDLLPPDLVRELAVMRARWLANLPGLTSLLTPEPTPAAPDAPGRNGARSPD
jgi:hypothetical protein